MPGTECRPSPPFQFYVQRRFRLRQPLRALVQLALFLGALFVCLSRVSDYKHRLSDVLGGAALGALFAWFFLRHVLHDFRPNRYATAELLGQPGQAGAAPGLKYSAI